MTIELMYLKANVQIEPLVDHWYAWSHLIPPATAARNITDRHLKIMDSYINAPQVHANAVRNPKLLGGPFVDYGGKRVDEIKKLKEQKKRTRSPFIQVSRANASLDRGLSTHPQRSSLRPLYD